MFHDTDSYYYLWLSDKLLAGQSGAYSPLVYSIVWVARLFGGSEHMMEVVAAWYPAVAGALLIIPVYFLGVAVFDSKFVGMLGAFLVAVLPTVLFTRSLLGNADHHVLEALLTTIILLCAVQLLKGSRLLWLAGGLVALGLYWQVWQGARLIVGVIFVYALILGVLALAQRKPGAGDYFAVVAVVVFGAMAIYQYQIASILYSDALFINSASVTRWAISEARPFPPMQLFASFGYYFLPFASVGMLITRLNRASGLFLLWSMIMIIITFLQARWGYYSAIPVALYAAWFIWWVAQRVKVAAVRRIVTGALIVIPLMMSMFTISAMASLPVDITPDWYAASRWLRYNTPDGGDSYTHTPQFIEYTVLSWWDFGYWIQRIGHRLPVVNPGNQSAVPEASRFFTAVTIESALEVIDGLNVRYVMVSKRMVTDMYWVMALDAGVSVSTLPESAAYQLYYDGEFAGFKLVKEFGEVRIFESTTHTQAD